MSMAIYNIEIVIGTDIYPYQKVEADNIKSAYLEAYKNIKSSDKPYDQLEEWRIGVIAFVYTDDPKINNCCEACDSNDLFEITQNGLKTCQACGYQQKIPNWGEEDGQ